MTQRLGDSALFASLWAARQADVIYPLDQDLLAGILQDVTGAKVAAWQWLTDGAQL